MAGLKRKIDMDSDIGALQNELDQVLCPICMEHPHNAVLLLCSSYEKGCRPYICDTSYRHSNCLDRFKKLRADSRTASTSSSSLQLNTRLPTNTSDVLSTEVNVANLNGIATNGIQEYPRPSEAHDSLRAAESEIFWGRSDHEESDVETSELKLSLKCPLCRGTVLGWEAVKEARKYLDMKKRSCSGESCSFIGDYHELRRHARKVHPTSRPSDVDPSRERDWQNLEHQREYGDVVSVIRSAMPEAVVVGDYVIESGEQLPFERENASRQASGPWLANYLLIQMFDSFDSAGESRARSRVWPRYRRSSGALTERQYLWGENLLGLQDEEDDNDNDFQVPTDVANDASPVPRRRRRLTRSRSGEDQP